MQNNTLKIKTDEQEVDDYISYELNERLIKQQ